MNRSDFSAKASPAKRWNERVADTIGIDLASCGENGKLGETGKTPMGELKGLDAANALTSRRSRRRMGVDLHRLRRPLHADASFQ